MDHVIELALLLCLEIPSFNSLVMVYLSSVVSPHPETTYGLP